MFLRSLKSKLVTAVSAMVIGSGLLISLLVTQRYSNNLYHAMTAQAETLAHVVAMEASDKILVNDLVGLQKMLDYQVRSNPSVAYLFVHKHDRVLAHTFSRGIPAKLLKANDITPERRLHRRKIVSTKGEQYLDIAWPVFGGKAGTLRLGFSEKPYRSQVAALWLQMSALTLTILLLAVAGTLLFIRRITRPLDDLTRATREIDQGEIGIRVRVKGRDEVAKLGVSFNHMVARIEEYTRRLEEQTMELERAHHQTRIFCNVVQEIGALRTLGEIGAFLIRRFQGIMKCRHMALLIFGGNKEVLFVLSPSGPKALRKPEVVADVGDVLEQVNKVTFSGRPFFKTPVLPADFQDVPRQGIFPVQFQGQSLGALVAGCGPDCRCSVDEGEVVALILNHSAGVLRRAVMQEDKIRDLQDRLEVKAEFCGIVGKDPKMQVIYRLIEDISPTDTTVLIQGESGTGKELVAEAIHHLSQRKGLRFVVINCSGYPETLLESELFGHEKGAFTGAMQQKIGRFEQADGGTVFLDEIGEISPSAQIRLLRVLQTRKFERVGGTKTHSVDVRILAATNKDLLAEVKAGRFREDLFYRLNVIPMVLPPLRDRINDIPLLARFFLSHFAREQHKAVEGFSPRAMRLLLSHSWPGNVRELENTIEHAVVLARGTIIEAIDFPSGLLGHPGSLSHPEGISTLEDHEKQLLSSVLHACSWNKKEAAGRLGISRSTLYEKLKKYQITRPLAH